MLKWKKSGDMVCLVSPVLGMFRVSVRPVLLNAGILGYSCPLHRPGGGEGAGHKACGCSLHGSHQIFRVCLPQEDLELIRIWGGMQ